MIWVGVCLGAGYLFGNVPIVKNNFTLVMLGIVFVSVLPAAYEFLKHRPARALSVTTLLRLSPAAAPPSGARCAARLATFLTMAYILLANPAILAAAGVPAEAAVAATALAAGLASILMGLGANVPSRWRRAWG